MGRILSVLCAVAVMACSTSLKVDDGAFISCRSDAQCPERFACDLRSNSCIVKGATPPTQSVAFTLPRDGDANVSTTGTLIVAFSLPVDLVSARGLVGLRDAGGAVVELEVGLSGQSEASTDNTILVTPRAELGSLSSYTLVVAPGVSAAAPQHAVPSEHEVQVTFTTAERRDRVAPAPPADLFMLVDRVAGDRADLSWQNPAEPDLAGVLILRRAQTPLVLDPTLVDNDLPVPGVAYAAGQQVGAAEVAAVVAGDHVSLLGLEPSLAYDFAIFWFDQSSNYSLPRRVPFVTGASTLWCPSQSGSFHVDSADLGEGAVLWRVAPSDPYVRFPAAPVPLGSEVAIGVSDIVLGAEYQLRYAARGPSGEYRSPPEEFIASRADLSPRIDPGSADVAKIGRGATAVFGFTAYGWPAFEAAVDLDPQTEVAPPAASNAVWQTLSVSSRVDVRSPMNDGGSFKLRVRPVVPGCADASWIESREFLVGGGVRYVNADAGLGSDTNDGLSPLSPFQTIARALSDVASEDLDILVAEGTYPEGVTLRSHARIFGGYGANFAVRDAAPRDAPAQHETILTGTVGIRGSSTSVASIFAPAFVQSALVDGVTVQAQSTTATEMWGAYLDNGWTVNGGPQYSGANVVLNRNRIFSGTSTMNNSSGGGVSSGCDATQVVSNNVIISQAKDGYNDFGVRVGCSYVGSSLTIDRNLIRASEGVLYDASYTVGLPATNRLTLTNNRLEGRDEATAPTQQNTYMLRLAGSGPEVVAHDNVFAPKRRAGQNTGETNTVVVDGNAFGVLERNFIDGGNNCSVSTGVVVSNVAATSQTLAFFNNVISAGRCANGRKPVRITGNVPVLFAHNTMVSVADGLVLTNNALRLVHGDFGGGGRFVNNLFMNVSDRYFLFVEGSVQSLQNNLVMASPYLRMAWNNGSPLTDLAVFEAAMCGNTVSGCTGDLADNAMLVGALADWFVSAYDPGLDLDAQGLDVWRPKASAAASFAVGLDTTAASNHCGPGACTGSATGSCGSVSVDYTGKPRPATPAAGAFEP